MSESSSSLKTAILPPRDLSSGWADNIHTNGLFYEPFFSFSMSRTLLRQIDHVF